MDKKSIIKKCMDGKGGCKKDGKGGPGMLSNIGKKVVGVASNVISAPQQFGAWKAKNRADSDVNILKKARGYDNAPDWNKDGSLSDAQKMRSAAKDVKKRLLKKKVSGI